MTAITAENISSTNSSEAGKTTDQQQQQQQQQDDSSESQQQQQRRRESSTTNNTTFKDAQSDFINAVKNGILELMDKHGYSRERATTTMVRKLHRSGNNTPPSEDEVFRAMETYGLSIDDATNTLVVSKAFKNLKTKQGLSDITSIDSLTSKLSLSNLLQEDSDDEEDFHPDDVNTSYLFHRYQRRHKDSESSSPSSSMKGVTTSTSTAASATTHPSSPKNNNNNKNNNKSSSSSSSSSRSNNKSSSSSQQQQQQHKLSSKQQRKRPFVEKDANKTTPTKSLDAKTIDLKRDRADSVSDELDAKLAANNKKMLLSSQTPETPTTASSSGAASRAKSPTQIVVRTKRGVHHLSKTDDDLHVKPSAAVAAVASKRPRTV